MSEQLRTILFSLKAFSNDSREALKKALFQLQDKVHLHGLSSVYRIKNELQTVGDAHGLQETTNLEGLILVAKATTQLLPEELRRLFQEIASKNSSAPRRLLVLELLTYDEETQMTPHLTMPNPELHCRPEFLFPAAEVWGEFTHPVLKKSLTELSRKLNVKDWGEFVLQGKSLLDF